MVDLQVSTVDNKKWLNTQTSLYSGAGAMLPHDQYVHSDHCISLLYE